MIRVCIVLAAAATALLVTASSGAKSFPKVIGTVGPQATITLTKGGKKVTSLKAGKYTFVIRDKSTEHNFHLTGPGTNKKTAVGTTATKTWTITVKKGRYRYVCDPHADFMKGSFRGT